ncbi:expressed unknown protein [Seminavis robusta]|uniref:Uncharacterized protein n=1 Tax=Seminavis robusta TaxID=568900 RepID=A0A9N8EGA1_9STRA|nr:expressed unknown protein [Seminavis robusta]|eukprot:Sro955_g224460.1 n/a (1401) ;mRNA; f:33093-37295
MASKRWRVFSVKVWLVVVLLVAQHVSPTLGYSSPIWRRGTSSSAFVFPPFDQNKERKSRQRPLWTHHALAASHTNDDDNPLLWNARQSSQSPLWTTTTTTTPRKPVPQKTGGWRLKLVAWLMALLITLAPAPSAQATSTTTSIPTTTTTSISRIIPRVQEMLLPATFGDHVPQIKPKPNLSRHQQKQWILQQQQLQQQQQQSSSSVTKKSNWWSSLATTTTTVSKQAQTPQQQQESSNVETVWGDDIQTVDQLQAMTFLLAASFATQRLFQQLEEDSNNNSSVLDQKKKKKQEWKDVDTPPPEMIESDEDGIAGSSFFVPPAAIMEDVKEILQKSPDEPSALLLEDDDDDEEFLEEEELLEEEFEQPAGDVPPTAQLPPFLMGNTNVTVESFQQQQEQPNVPMVESYTDSLETLSYLEQLEARRSPPPMTEQDETSTVVSPTETDASMDHVEEVSIEEQDDIDQVIEGAEEVEDLEEQILLADEQVEESPSIDYFDEPSQTTETKAVEEEAECVEEQTLLGDEQVGDSAGVDYFEPSQSTETKAVEEKNEDVEEQILLVDEESASVDYFDKTEESIAAAQEETVEQAVASEKEIANSTLLSSLMEESLMPTEEPQQQQTNEETQSNVTTPLSYFGSPTSLVDMQNDILTGGSPPPDIPSSVAEMPLEEKTVLEELLGDVVEFNLGSEDTSSTPPGLEEMDPPPPQNELLEEEYIETAGPETPNGEQQPVHSELGNEYAASTPPYLEDIMSPEQMMEDDVDGIKDNAVNRPSYFEWNPPGIKGDAGLLTTDGTSKTPTESSIDDGKAVDDKPLTKATSNVFANSAAREELTRRQMLKQRLDPPLAEPSTNFVANSASRDESTRRQMLKQRLDLQASSAASSLGEQQQELNQRVEPSTNDVANSKPGEELTFRQMLKQRVERQSSAAASLGERQEEMNQNVEPSTNVVTNSASREELTRRQMLKHRVDLQPSSSLGEQQHEMDQRVEPSSTSSEEMMFEELGRDLFESQMDLVEEEEMGPKKVDLALSSDASAVGAEEIVKEATKDLLKANTSAQEELEQLQAEIMADSDETLAKIDELEQDMQIVKTEIMNDKSIPESDVDTVEDSGPKVFFFATATQENVSSPINSDDVALFAGVLSDPDDYFFLSPRVEPPQPKALPPRAPLLQNYLPKPPKLIPPSWTTQPTHTRVPFRPFRKDPKPYVKLIPINEKAVELTSGLLGAAVGFSIGGPVLGLLSASAAHFVSRDYDRAGDLHDITNMISESTIGSINVAGAVLHTFEVDDYLLVSYNATTEKYPLLNSATTGTAKVAEEALGFLGNLNFMFVSSVVDLSKAVQLGDRTSAFVNELVQKVSEGSSALKLPKPKHKKKMKNAQPGPGPFVAEARGDQPQTNRSNAYFFDMK